MFSAGFKNRANELFLRGNWINVVELATFIEERTFIEF